jgi:hypothetical protein
MDIHKPKPIHGWKDLLKEVGVIVIGVLIALSAEQVVQALDWREKIHRADIAMRDEIAADDGPQVLERLALTDCIEASLRTIRSEVEGGAGRAEVLAAIGRYGVPGHTWDSQAFDSARTEGVTLRGDVRHVGWWNVIFYTMPSLDRTNERELDDAAPLSAISRVGGPLTEAEKDRILLAVETLSRHDRRMTAKAGQVQVGMQQLHIAIEPHAEQRELDILAQTPGAGACIGKYKALVAAAK